MRTVALGDLCDVTIGRTPARADPTFWGGTHAWLSIADMNNGHIINSTKERITDVAAAAGKPVEPGTVLLSFKLSIGKVARAGIRLYTNEAIAALPIRDPGVLDASYLARALESMELAGGANRAAMGATLNKAALLAIPVPVPPLDEQRRIAAILDKADEIRTKRREAVAHLDTLLQSVFRSMFGSVRAAADVVEIATNTRTGPFGSQLLHSEFVEHGVAVLGLDNVVGNEFRWADRRFITSAKYEQLKRYTVQPGDVLISIMGTTGRCVVVPDDIPVAINTKHICAITVDPGRIHPEFLRATFLWHPDARAHLRRQTKGSIMDGLNMSIIKAMPVPVPPLDLQKDFAAKAAAIAAQRTTLERAIAADDELFASLQSRAFRGEL